MKKAETTNVFTDGLIMDLNPIVTPNNVISNALNATLITMNGNENSLQNDMGNGRVETAYLPEGYVPLGTTELGGIIYIVSYNPLNNHCQIGSFPSPERNISSSEMQVPEVSITNSYFQVSEEEEKDYGKIKNVFLKVKLLSNSELNTSKLNPGDKYVIYSTNSGISNNKDRITDVGNTSCQFDTLPRNLTIHVISIGDDGKITYLDDSLKWTGENDSPEYFYIRECQQKEGEDISSSINTDIDSYRTLVSSAYNIFNSKTPGELALLLELEVITSFSVTWDADVADIEEVSYNKSARISFYLNYTSEHPYQSETQTGVNLQYAILTDSTIADGSELGVPVEKGSYCTIDQEQIKNRKNDGTDPDITVVVGNFKYDSKKTLSNYVWNYEVTPAMSFGYLEYLSVRGSINFQEIGSGKIEIDEWKYFIQDNNFYLNWGLSAYPEKNKKIEKVVFTFIPFDKVSKTSVITDNKTVPSSNYPQYIVSDKNSYSGYFQELIDFGENSKVKNGTIIPDYLYLVDICIYYGDQNNMEYRHNYKWLYTTKQWNDKFNEESITDFSELTLNDVLTFSANMQTQDYIDEFTTIYNSQNLLPRTIKDTYVEGTMGAQITTVNYSSSPLEFTNNNCINAVLVPLCTSYPKLFEFGKTTDDTYEINIVSTSITHDELTPTSDRASTFADEVISFVSDQKDSSQLSQNLAQTIYEISNNGILSEDVNQKAVDQFSAVLSNQNDASFSLIIKGAIFSRINAELITKLVTVGQEIRPLLYYADEYPSVGLASSDSFSDYFIETHRDLGGGKPFAFRFRTSTGNYDHESTKEEWNPTDSFDYQNWWDVPPYVDYLNSWMMEANGFIQCMRWDGGESTQYGNTNIQGMYGLWVRTSENRYIPINHFSTAQSNLAKIVAMKYLSMYYVNVHPEPRTLAVVDSINYLTSYTETWNIEIAPKLWINNILSNIKLLSSTGSTNSRTLSELNDICDGINEDGGKEFINLSNITFSIEDKALVFPNTTIKHTFNINNSELYNKYEQAKSTTIPAIGMPSTSEKWFECSPKTQNYIYVYNKELKDFQQLTNHTAKLLYNGGTISSEEVEELERDRLFIENPTYCATQNMIYSGIEYLDGQVQLSEKILLQSKQVMKFETNATGTPTSTIANNSSYTI